MKVTTTDGEVLTGRIIECDEESAELDVSGSKRQVQYEDVAKALVQIEFNRPGSASKGRSKGKSSGTTGTTGKET